MGAGDARPLASYNCIIFQPKLRLSLTKNKMRYKFSYNSLNYYNFLGGIGDEHHCPTIMGKVAIIEALHKNIILGDDVPEIDESPFYDENAFKEYPMLTLVDSLGYNTDWPTLFDYIKLIDRST